MCGCGWMCGWDMCNVVDKFHLVTVMYQKCCYIPLLVSDVSRWLPHQSAATSLPPCLSHTRKHTFTALIVDISIQIFADACRSCGVPYKNIQNASFLTCSPTNAHTLTQPSSSTFSFRSCCRMPCSRCLVSFVSSYTSGLSLALSSWQL